MLFDFQSGLVMLLHFLFLILYSLSDIGILLLLLGMYHSTPSLP